MARQLPPLNALRAFEAAARHESFTRAADELYVTQGAVSHQVKALEETLGVQLFNRKPQGLMITQAGQDYLEVVRDAFDRLALGTDRLLQRQNSKILTVSTSRNFASKWLVHRLGKFAEAFPDIDLRISASSHVVDFAREDVDVAIRNTSGKLSGLEGTRLYKEELFPVCSPELAQRVSKPNAYSEILNLPMLHLDNREDWGKWLDAAGIDKKEQQIISGPIMNQSGMIIDACVDGQGVALARTALVAQDLIAGRLVRPFNLSLPVNYAYWVVCPKATAQLPKIEMFKKWICAEIAIDQRKLDECAN